MARKNVVIVGAGLFGSIAARVARARGHNVTIVDAGRPYAASPASGCVIAPSWLVSMDRSARDHALDALTSLYPVHDVAFTTGLGARFSAVRVGLLDLLIKPDITLNVERVGDGVAVLEDGTKLKGYVLVAAGVWSGELVDDLPRMRKLYGASLLYPSVKLKTPMIRAYAPYKQLVAFYDPARGTWVGDGTAVAEETWVKSAPDRIKALLGRAESLGINGRSTVTVGARPYVEGHKAGYYEQVHSRTWVSTGGAKNGTALAAYYALCFANEALA